MKITLMRNQMEEIERKASTIYKALKAEKDTELSRKALSNLEDIIILTCGEKGLEIVKGGGKK